MLTGGMSFEFFVKKIFLFLINKNLWIFWSLQIVHIIYVFIIMLFWRFMFLNYFVANMRIFCMKIFKNEKGDLNKNIINILEIKLNF